SSDHPIYGTSVRWEPTTTARLTDQDQAKIELVRDLEEEGFLVVLEDDVAAGFMLLDQVRV
ncbi:MAG: hypothetical protein KAJ81_01385, partial [Candidatus Latescibacteria bacterium]|nr:hypothetical protein [Candidatus Latescibacterota bacterium]